MQEVAERFREMLGEKGIGIWKTALAVFPAAPQGTHPGDDVKGKKDGGKPERGRVRRFLQDLGAAEPQSRRARLPRERRTSTGAEIPNVHPLPEPVAVRIRYATKA